MAGVNSANQLGYAAIESAFGTAAAATNSNAFKLVSLSTNPEQDEIQRPDKNSSLSQTIGIGGNKRGSWSTRMSLAGSAAAGTAPDIGPLLQAAFGKAATVVASTSVTYGLDDLSPSVTIWSFWSPSTATQYVSIGSVVNQMNIDASGTTPTIEFSGPALWCLDTDQFANADTTAKGGLGSFPAQPGSPVTNGSMVSLFSGSASLDSNSLAEIRTFRLSANMAREIPQDTIFSGQYGGSPSQGRRNITFDLNVYDKAGDSNFSSLLDKAIRKVSVPVVLTLGSTAGSRVVITLANVLLGTPTVDDGQQKKAISFTGCRAHASSGTAKDELVMAWT
jgi:hypothetical protein